MPQALGDLQRVLVAGAGEDHQDLLAADPVDRVARPQGRPHRVGDVLQDRVAGGVAELVVDPLEVVEVAEEEGVGEALAGIAGLAVELGQPLLERVAVEEAGERVEGRAAAVGAVGLDQGAGEDHGAEDQGGGRRSAAGAVPGGAAGRAGPPRRGTARSRRRCRETIPRGSKRKPRVTAGRANQTSDRAGGAAGDEDRGGEQHRQRRPGAGDPDRRTGAAAHEAVGDREAGEAERRAAAIHQ